MEEICKQNNFYSDDNNDDNFWFIHNLEKTRATNIFLIFLLKHQKQKKRKKT